MEEEISRIFDKHPEVVAVYLFGSFAKGLEKEKSDVDIAILLDPQRKADEFSLKRALIIELSRELRKDIHLVVMNRAGELLSAQIFKYGKCLFDRAPTLLSFFRMVQYSKIADFAFLRRNMEKGFTRKIMRAVS